MSISVALLAYKEEENLRLLIPKVIEVMEKMNEKYEIFIIDSQYPLDNTKGVCDEYGVSYYNQTEPHYAGAYKEAIKLAKNDKFLLIDADGSCDPKYIKDMYNKYNEGYDVVIGSRYTKGGGTTVPKYLTFMSKIVNIVFRTIIGVKVKDISISFRLYNTEKLKQIKITSTNYEIQEEIILRLKMINPNIKIAEVPIIFVERWNGETKRQLLKFIICYITSIFKFIGIKFRFLK
jgi:putative glycosyl transferase protein